MITTRPSIAFALLALCLAFVASCADQIGNPPPGGGSGSNKLVYNYFDFSLDQPFNTAKMYLTDSTGLSPRELFPWASSSGRYAVITSSANGRIAFVSADTGDHARTSVYISDNSGLTASCIYSSTGDSLDCFPILSPDGQHLALLFREGVPDNRILVVYTLTNIHDTIAATDSHIITTTAEDDLQPGCFSPDGSRIVYYGNVGSSEALMIANSDGTGKGTLAILSDGSFEEDDAVLSTRIAWSTNGDEIAFRNGAGLSAIRADGSGQLTVDDSGVAPSWSPDGKTLAYTSIRGGNAAARILLTNDLGNTKRVLQTTNTLACASPHWSPDGRKIFATAGVPGFQNPSSVEVIDVATGATRILATPGYEGVWLR